MNDTSSTKTLTLSENQTLDLSVSIRDLGLHQDLINAIAKENHFVKWGKNYYYEGGLNYISDLLEDREKLSGIWLSSKEKKIPIELDPHHHLLCYDYLKNDVGVSHEKIMLLNVILYHGGHPSICGTPEVLRPATEEKAFEMSNSPHLNAFGVSEELIEAIMIVLDATLRENVPNTPFATILNTEKNLYFLLCEKGLVHDVRALNIMLTYCGYPRINGTPYSVKFPNN